MPGTNQAPSEAKIIADLRRQVTRLGQTLARLLLENVNAAADPIVIGTGADATGSTRSIAIGYDAAVLGATFDAGIAIGFQASAGSAFADNQCIAIGNSANASKTLAVAIGGFAAASGDDAIAIGQSATASGDPDSIAIGSGAQATAIRATALGQGAVATAINATAVGDEAGATGQSSVSIGDNSGSVGDQSVAIGASAQAQGNKTIAIGNAATAHFAHSTAVGAEAVTAKANQVMLGTALDFVEIPGNGSANGLVLTDTATGTRHLVQITSGALVLVAAP